MTHSNTTPSTVRPCNLYTQPTLHFYSTVLRSGKRRGPLSPPTHPPFPLVLVYAYLLILRGITSLWLSFYTLASVLVPLSPLPSTPSSYMPSFFIQRDITSRWPSFLTMARVLVSRSLSLLLFHLVLSFFTSFELFSLGPAPRTISPKLLKWKLIKSFLSSAPAASYIEFLPLASTTTPSL